MNNINGQSVHDIKLAPIANLFGVIIFLIGLVILTTANVWLGILWIIASFFIIPRTFRIIQSRIGKKLSRRNRLYISSSIIFISMVIGIIQLPKDIPQPVIGNYTSTTTLPDAPRNNSEITNIQQNNISSEWQKTPAGQLCAKYAEWYWKKDACDAIIAKKLLIGMTKKQAELSWGKPDKINTTESAYSTKEQWVYGLGKYVYFEDGILTTIQDTSKD